MSFPSLKDQQQPLVVTSMAVAGQ